MKLDPNPIHRRQIIPWYDSDPACLMLLAAMVVALLFGVVGVAVARRNAVYAVCLWVPLLLAGLSGTVALSVAVRLFHRYLQRF